MITGGLGGIVLVATQYTSGASWSVAFRRLPEGLAAAVPVGAVGLLALVVIAPAPVLWGASGAGPWESVATTALLGTEWRWQRRWLATCHVGRITNRATYSTTPATSKPPPTRPKIHSIVT